MVLTEQSSPSFPFARILLALSVFAVLYLPFASKPVHIDDANFLMLAEGAARDPWRPHSIEINWSGKTEPAFDILANPPGIAWYLAPVRKSPEWVLHLWMLPWLALGAWGCWRLGMDFADGAGYATAMFLLTCPVTVISAHMLTPDLPVFALMSAGVAGFIAFPRLWWLFSVLAGSSALFRYSGCTVIPLLILIGAYRRGWRGAAQALFSAVPIVLLVLHDLNAYGRIHLLIMFASQNSAQKKTVLDALHNCVAGVAMLGGAGVLPILVWRGEAIIGAMVGAIVAFNVAIVTNLTMAQTIPTVLSISAGFAALSLAIAPRTRDLILSAWALGGAAFFYFVSFAATRYWAAFVPGVGLLAIRNARKSPWWLAAGIAVNVIVSFGIAWDDQNFAQGQKDAATKIAATYEPGTFSGHWGWQHYLEKAGWTAIERGGAPADIHALPCYGDAQMPDPTACLESVQKLSLIDNWRGPRAYSWYHRAFYHAGGRGQYAPWTLSDEPYDVVYVYRRCGSNKDGDSSEQEPKSQ